jgi:2,3-bisphosphoglycerate-independent phosphoglycerate mutase
MADQKKPNIVVIMADDVGTWNLSAYHRGMMGGSTPNIDRIASGVRCSLTITVSNHVRRGGPRSFLVRPLSAQAC